MALEFFVTVRCPISALHFQMTVGLLSIAVCRKSFGKSCQKSRAVHDDDGGGELGVPVTAWIDSTRHLRRLTANADDFVDGLQQPFGEALMFSRFNAGRFSEIGHCKGLFT